MSTLGIVIKQIISNTLGMFVYGEFANLEKKRGVTEKHTPAQEKRLRMSARFITKANVWLLNVSKGRLGNSFLGRPLLLLTTIGRKSGLPRTQPVFYLEDGQRILMVASNGGYSEDPLWLLNAKANPQVSIRIKGGHTRNMLLRIASDEEKAQLWPAMTEAFPYWQEVSDRCERNIPIAILDPVTP